MMPSPNPQMNQRNVRPAQPQFRANTPGAVNQNGQAPDGATSMQGMPQRYRGGDMGGQSAAMMPPPSAEPQPNGMGGGTPPGPQLGAGGAMPAGNDAQPMGQPTPQMQAFSPVSRETEQARPQYQVGMPDAARAATSAPQQPSMPPPQPYQRQQMAQRSRINRMQSPQRPM